jgi:protein TonB
MKKNSNHLESRRPSFLLVGLMASLSLTLVAFEWTGFNYEDPDYVDSGTMVDWEPTIPNHIVKTETAAPKNRKARSHDFVIGDPDKSEKEKVEFSLKPVLAGIDTGTGEDYDEPGETSIPITVGWGGLGNKPHYADCENVVNREEQATCTEVTIIQFVADNTKFPRDLRGMNATVYVNFVIDTDGSITDVEPLKGPEDRAVHPLFEKAAIKAVKKLPKMVPGEQLGKPVRVRFLIPVRFTTAP